jgi:hypothetical protein
MPDRITRPMHDIGQQILAGVRQDGEQLTLVGPACGAELAAQAVSRSEAKALVATAASHRGKFKVASR